MKSFDQLTRAGQARRLRRLAIQALTQYDLDVRSVQLLGMFTNTLFRVDTWDGQAYVMRTCAPGWRTDRDLQSEMMWLADLERFPEIHAPKPVPSRKGAWVVTDQVPGLIPVRCMVMSFLPGKPLGKHLTPGNLRKMGELFARLHQAALEFTPPEEFTRRKMDQVLARGEPGRLFTAEVEAQLPRAAWELLVEVREKVNGAYARLYGDPAGLRVIHHDLWHDNIHLYRGQLYPLDFEDTCWGYPVQDIAMAMQDLMQDTPPGVFDELLMAFRQGYESLLPWPETYPGQMDIFRAGRMLWVANWVAWKEPEFITSHVERVAPMLQAFLATGQLRKEAGLTNE